MYVHVSDRKYWVEDEGQGPVLLMLHGFTGSSRTYDETAAFLPRTFRLIKIDLPGHARTGPIGVVTMERFCKDLLSILEQLNISSLSILGYSLGGRAALSFVTLYPGLVDKVLLESSSPGLANSEDRVARQERDRALAEKIRTDGLEEFIAFWENIPLFQSQETLPAVSKQKLRNERLKQNPTGLIESLQGMGTGKQPSWWDRLSGLNRSVWLVTGTEDSKFREINRKMNGQLRESKWIEVDDTGHCVHLEKPRFFAKIVQDFMVQ